jgi:hypothetical protein
LVITISGRCRRTLAQIARRSGTQHSISQAEKLHRLNTDNPRRLDLLGFPYPPGLGRFHSVNASLAAGHHGIDHCLSLVRPAGYGRCSTELEIIGMRHHTKRSGPGLIDRFQIRHGLSV